MERQLALISCGYHTDYVRRVSSVPKLRRRARKVASCRLRAHRNFAEVGDQNNRHVPVKNFCVKAAKRQTRNSAFDYNDMMTIEKRGQRKIPRRDVDNENLLCRYIIMPLCYEMRRVFRSVAGLSAA